LNDAHKINLVAELAQEAESADPIDWGYLKIDEKTAYKMMASHVVEEFANSAHHELVMLSTITKLLVENFVLNLKLNGQDKTKSI
jgi:hypothetical protein